MSGNVVGPGKRPAVVDDSAFEQKVLFWLFGIFVVLSSAFIGTYVGYVIFGGLAIMAYVFGFSFLLFVLGVLGIFTVILRRTVQEVTIKIVQDQQ